MRKLLAALALSCLAAWPLASAAAQGYCAALGAYYPYVRNCPGPWYPGPSYAPGYVAPGYVAPGYVAPGVASPPVGRAYAPPPPPPADAPPPAREATEEEANAHRADGAEIGMRREADAVEGYRTVTVAAAIRRFESMGSSGVVITGYYAPAARIATLADDPGAADRIFVVSDKLPRAGRKMLSDCSDCRITIWARKGCAKGVLGEQANAPCLVIERVKKDTYEANTTIYR